VKKKRREHAGGEEKEKTGKLFGDNRLQRREAEKLYCREQFRGGKRRKYNSESGKGIKKGRGCLRRKEGG